MPTSQRSTGKSSFTFESVVCSQIELQRRAASFSHRRSTTCRKSSQYPSSSSSSNHLMFLSPMTTQLSTSTPSDITIQFLKTRNSTGSKRSRTSSSFQSVSQPRLTNATDRNSLASMFYWERSSSSRSFTRKQDGSRWSLDFPRATPLYWSLRSRLIEEYTESESLLEFAKKTLLVLMKTREVTLFLCILLILPIIMMGIGVGHLNDCPRQTNLPIYLFVAGIVWTTKLLQNLCHKYRLQQKRLTGEEPSSDQNDGHAFIDALMTSFLIIWFFFGQYWLFNIGYPPHFEQLLHNPYIWCHKTVVYCTFISIILTYFILITFIIIILFLVFFTRYTIIKRATAT